MDKNADKQEINQQVPRRNRLFWGLGGFTDHAIIYGMNGLVNVIYINALGINAVLVSLACAVPRFLDCLSDPLVGHLSDRTRSRWGRRRPYLLAGLLLSALLSMLLWFPPLPNIDSDPAVAQSQVSEVAPQQGETPVDSPTATGKETWWHTAGKAMKTEWRTFIFLLVMTTLLYAVGYTLFNIPHIAMGYEMTTDYDERTHLFKWRYVAFAAGGFMTPWLMPLCMWFEGDQADILKGSQGVIPVSILFGMVIVLTGLPSLFCRERPVAVERQSQMPLRQAIRATLHNRPFWLLVAGNFFARFGMAITGIFFFYVFVYHIGKGEQLKGVALSAVFFNAINITNFLAMSPIAALSNRLGKKPTLQLMMAMSAVAYISLWFTFSNHDSVFISHTFSIGNLSWTLTMQWPSLLTAALIGVFTNTIPMIANSMIADICDYDELENGERREGFFGAVYTSLDKLATSASLVFQGVLLAASGFNASLAVQSPETIRYWFLALVLTQPIGFMFGIFLLFFYPLNRDRMHNIRTRLDIDRAGR